MRQRVSITVAVLTLLAMSAGSAPTAAQDEEEYRESYRGTLVAIGGEFAGRTETFTLTLTGRTPPQQAKLYVDLLRRSGQNGLLRRLRDRDLGRFALTGRTGLPVNFAYQQRTPEGRRLIVLFERWMQICEMRQGLRSRNYPFSYLELSLDENGSGGGTMIGAARVYFEREDPSTLTVENYGTYPLRVMNVERER
jgi:hypothetical protein